MLSLLEAGRLFYFYWLGLAFVPITVLNWLLIGHIVRQDMKKNSRLPLIFAGYYRNMLLPSGGVLFMIVIYGLIVSKFYIQVSAFVSVQNG